MKTIPFYIIDGDKLKAGLEEVVKNTLNHLTDAVNQGNRAAFHNAVSNYQHALVDAERSGASISQYARVYRALIAKGAKKDLTLKKKEYRKQ